MAPSMPEEDDAQDATGGPDPVQVGIEQFQRAALEAIRAGRAMLDAAESVLQDPKAAESVVRSVGSVARTATDAFSGFAAGRWAPRHDQSGDAGAPPTGDGRDDGPDGFERIIVD
jgi:hypothetical protein